MDINPEIINDLKNFDWTSVLEVGSRLQDLNDRQWRFVKGLVVELSVEKSSGEDGFIYIGKDGKDFIWQRYGINVELKSQFSNTMYKKSGELRSRYVIKLNNSNGTNKKDYLTENNIADVLIVVRQDGAFVLDKHTVLSNIEKHGDGFTLVVTKDQILEISGRLLVEKKSMLNLRENIIDSIKKVI